MKKFASLAILFFSVLLLSAQVSELSKVALVQDHGNWIKFLPDTRISPDEFFDAYQSDLGLNDSYHFQLIDEETDALGITHLRFQAYFQGTPIQGSEYILHTKDGFISHANGKLAKGMSASKAPQMSAADGLTIAKKFMGSDVFYWEMPIMEARIKHIKNDPNATFLPQGELVYAHPKFNLDGAEYQLAWKYEIYAPRPAGKKTVFVDATSGNVLFAIEGCHEGAAEGTAETRYSGTQTIITDSISETEYRLVDVTRGGGIETYDANQNTDISLSVDFVDDDNHWDNANDQFDDAATDVHWGMEQSYDYYLDVHSRNSFDDEDSPIISYVHVDTLWYNATFNGMWAEFGDGPSNPLTSIDIVAHELTHGVTGTSANLVYLDEPGALNESFSDIFGTAIEFYARGEEADWLMGDANFVLRDVENPNQYGQPDTYFGTNWFFGAGDNGGVHTNSGVQNFWFYLLCNGGEGVNDNGDTYSVDSIGMEKAAAISYRSLTNYLTTGSNYLDARSGSLQAAEDLYGTCADEVLQVLAAWYAVGVGLDVITHDIQLLEVLSPVDSGCDLGASEPVEMLIRFNPTGCGHTLESGDEIEVSYQINGAEPIVEIITLTETLNGGDVLNHEFQTPADFSEIGQYELNFEVSLEGDLNQANDAIEGIELSKSLILDDDNTIAFETFPAVYDSFYVEIRAHSEAAISTAAANSGIGGFRLNGVGVSPDNVNPPESEEENFTANPDFISKICMCVDATLWDEAYLSFDLRQTFSAFYFEFTGQDIPEAIALRVTVDGVQVGDQFHPTTYNSDPYLTHIMDLNEYAGSSFSLCFEGIHFLNEDEDFLPQSAGDKSQLDNIFLSQNEILSVEKTKITEARIYPNPTSGLLGIELDIIGNQEVTVLDVLGNVLQIENWNATGSKLELDLSQYASGIYFISIQSESVQVMQKVVVE